ncbi:jg18124 [Pararge aegeria aegeria]|uniref:Jg18124 protein n=1 Tax=Pararge aegeria aegeria TaxID=348720 RepID=A0A8S4S213_9NEOP|nr:jg18124 [Pararge aegeria aegeria]
MEGKHKEREDVHGYMTRRFTRRYLLPRVYDSDALESNLSSDGIVTLSAPKLALENRMAVVSIAQNGAVHRNTDNPAYEYSVYSKKPRLSLLWTLLKGGRVWKIPSCSSKIMNVCYQLPSRYNCKI